MKITERNSEEEQSNSKENCKLQAAKGDLIEKAEEKPLLKLEEPLEDENGEINISANVLSQPRDGQSTGKSQTNEVTEQNIVSIKKDLYNRLTLVKVLSETANTAR